MKTKWSRAAGVLVGLVLLTLSMLVAGIVVAYLTENGGWRFLAAAAIIGLGIAGGVVAYLLVPRYCQSRWRILVVLAIVVILLLAPLVSVAYPGQVTYSRFGLTVYGLVPVPVLDITVGPHGGLWFRDKSHFISMDEIQPLLSPEVEVLVIGIGWHSAVRVDSAIEQIEGLEIHILPTPEAFHLYNRSRAEGIKVALIAHSTC